MATFGKTNIGTLEFYGPIGYIWGCHFAPSLSGTVSKISAYVKNLATANVKVKIYENTVDVPTNLLAESSVMSVPTTFAWVDFPISLTVVAATHYWLYVHSAGQLYYKYDTVADAKSQSYKSGQSYPTNPNPHGAVSGQNNKEMSIYATYTPIVNGSISNVSLISLGLGAWLAIQKKKKRMKKSVLAKKIARDAMKPMVKYFKKVDEAIKKAV